MRRTFHLSIPLCSETTERANPPSLSGKFRRNGTADYVMLSHSNGEGKWLSSEPNADRPKILA